MLIVAKLITLKEYVDITTKSPLTHKDYKVLNPIRKLDQNAYNKAVTALELLNMISLE
jgi:hypothetical protein